MGTQRNHRWAIVSLCGHRTSLSKSAVFEVCDRGVACSDKCGERDSPRGRTSSKPSTKWMDAGLRLAFRIPKPTVEEVSWWEAMSCSWCEEGARS